MFLLFYNKILRLNVVDGGGTVIVGMFFLTLKSLDARGLLYIVMVSSNASQPVPSGLCVAFLNSYSLHVGTCIEPANRHIKGRILQARKTRDNVLVT
jgi:hypothetical protein